MYDTATRIGLVKERVRQKQRRREKRTLCSLSALCLFLAVSLVGTLGAFTGSGRPAALSAYGAVLLHEDVSGYVLVGVISFTAAVIITVLCIKYRERKKTNSFREDKQGKL